MCPVSTVKDVPERTVKCPPSQSHARGRSDSPARNSLHLRVAMPEIDLAADDPVFLFLHAPPCAQLVGWQGTGDEIALRLLAALELQVLELSNRLDAFRDHAQAEAVRERDDRLRDRLVVRVLLDAVHESLVDLHALDR